jgi:hypothetical protein
VRRETESCAMGFTDHPRDAEWFWPAVGRAGSVA